MASEEYIKNRIARTKKRRQQELMLRLLISGTLLVLLLLTVIIVTAVKRHKEKAIYVRDVEPIGDNSIEKYIATQPTLDVELLSINDYSRPGLALSEVNSIVVHWTANPGTSAIQNRNYFEGLSESHVTSASAHFVIGLEGEIVQCIPCNEIAYAVGDRNHDTISIECCIEDEDGKFNEKTYQSLIELTTWLMGRYHLTSEDVIRHNDVSGKDCPKYYVNHPEAWEAFLSDLDIYIETYGIEREVEEQ